MLVQYGGKKRSSRKVYCFAATLFSRTFVELIFIPQHVAYATLRWSWPLKILKVPRFMCASRSRIGAASANQWTITACTSAFSRAGRKGHRSFKIYLNFRGFFSHTFAKRPVQQRFSGRTCWNARPEQH